MGHLPPRPLPPHPPALSQPHLPLPGVGPGGPRGMMPPPPPPSHALAGPSPMPPPPFPRPPVPPSLNMPLVRPMPPSAPPPPTFSFSQNRPSTTSAAAPSVASYQQPKVVYAAPPVMNKPATESQKTASLDAVVTAVSTAAVKPSEELTLATNTAATTSTANAEPAHCFRH